MNQEIEVCLNPEKFTERTSLKITFANGRSRTFRVTRFTKVPRHWVASHLKSGWLVEKEAV